MSAPAAMAVALRSRCLREIIGFLRSGAFLGSSRAGARREFCRPIAACPLSNDVRSVEFIRGTAGLGITINPELLAQFRDGPVAAPLCRAAGSGVGHAPGIDDLLKPAEHVHARQ